MVKRQKKRPLVNDWHLWTEVKRSVSPLKPVLREQAETQDEAETIVAAGPPPPVFDKRARWSGPSLPAYSPAAQLVQGAEPGGPIEPRMRRRLMRGRIEIDGTLDLHGMRQAEARAVLQRYVVARAGRGDRTLLVITGKGLKKTDDLRILDRGVLRAMLPIWLAEPALAPYIAGYDSAAQGHGGEGAFYVRLRRVAK